MGLPITSKIFKKYLIDNKVKFPEEIEVNAFEVEEVYFLFLIVKKGISSNFRKLKI